MCLEIDSMDEHSSSEVGDALPFLVTVVENDNTMGLFSVDGTVVLRRIPVEVLRENLRHTADLLRTVFLDLAKEAAGLRLKEAQIGLEISAEGGVQLIGTAQVGAKAAITLVFGD
ncbi:hypothetical protein J5X84_42870 [Streptosporangiaceae bacterium NEAU-GS5]|nr:hypothetical protein [Streptosporangiaceae bacterium NEAU-GS5]